MSEISEKSKKIDGQSWDGSWMNVDQESDFGFGRR
jgi:hypothetical protein